MLCGKGFEIKEKRGRHDYFTAISRICGASGITRLCELQVFTHGIGTSEPAVELPAKVHDLRRFLRYRTAYAHGHSTARCCGGASLLTRHSSHAPSETQHGENRNSNRLRNADCAGLVTRCTEHTDTRSERRARERIEDSRWRNRGDQTEGDERRVTD